MAHSNWRRWLPWIVPFGLVLCGFVVWSWWGERRPEQERELRVRVHEQFQQWFPDEMALPEDRFGFLPCTTEGGLRERPDVVLLHGLDEPGGIWNDLIPVLQGAGWVVWEFRYPNDQGIDASADLLAKEWPALAEDHPVVLIGHSMGGLVIRDFVGRWRHPAQGQPLVTGATVRGVILVGTPNHGSEWARLRMWLELREVFSSAAHQQFSLFQGLRDGTGVAKIDLRPGSAFLTELNNRAWPHQVPIRIIGGLLAEPTPQMQRSLDALTKEIGTNEVTAALEVWWTKFGEELGDGVVPVHSLILTGVPPPTIVSASHRGLVARSVLSDEQPPAIPVIVEILEHWRTQ